MVTLNYRYLAVLGLALYFVIGLKAQTYSSLPFSDDLSSGALGSHWSFSDAQGIGAYSVTDLSGGWPNFGTCSGATCSNVGATSGNGLILYNSSSPSGSNQLNMDLHLDLSGKGTVELQQAIVDWRSGWDSLQVHLSNDGGSNFTYATTVKLWLSPYTDGVWNELTLDLSSLAATTGVGFSSTYVVRYATFLEYSGASSSPKSWPNQSVYFDNFKGSELAALPVELKTFSGVNSEFGTTLIWATSSEVNNDKFVVQRSFDGSTWETLAEVDGSGNSNMEINYEYTDSDVFSELTYYRLKQIDFDGTYKYSNAISFHTGEADPSMTVMKNGKSPIVSVNGVEEADIHILSMNGKAVWKKKAINGYWLDLDFLPTGNYVVMVKLDSGFFSEKITVIK